uniref:RNA polymerase II C-terminal domain phosphatase-like n=1 Tax=Kalanchoe fedtschenkoi TaxID=63787 RepID=A0A7N0UCH3_KALFE
MSVAADSLLLHSGGFRPSFLKRGLDSDSDELESRILKRRKKTEETIIRSEESQESAVCAASASSSSGPDEKEECSPLPGSAPVMGSVCAETDSGCARYIEFKDLWLLGSDELARLRARHVENLLQRKKLCMVLDLDHTLLHSARITPDKEAYLRDPPAGSFMVAPHIMTKPRPFVGEFLKEASSMFEMYIYTMGTAGYGAAVAKRLDPGADYFGTRVISRGDGSDKNQKSLDLVLAHDRAVVILDDTESVWSRHSENLILIEKYNFFDSGADESEHDGILASVLQVLKRIHCDFFDDPSESRDVRRGLRSLRRGVLEGCEIVFSGVIPRLVQPEAHQLWPLAEELGAKCCREVGPSVTHVVAARVGTKKARWAVQENKFLVDQKWIEAVNFRWKRLPENEFPVETTHQND